MTTGIRARGLSCTYAGADRSALDDVTVDVPGGRLVVVMGHSGAGKSTLARCLTRLVPAFHPAAVRGEIVLDGTSLCDRTVGDLAGRVGMVFQDFEAQLFSTDVTQEMVFALEQTGVPPADMPGRVREALDAVGLAGFEGRDPTTLSGGEKQRLAIAGLLALRPGVMVFDEPTTDLDPRGRAEVFRVLRVLRDQGLALLVIEHDTAVADGADTLVLLRDGRVAASGPPAPLLADVGLCAAAGVRAPDVALVFDALGLADPPRDVAAAAHRLREAGRVPTPPPDAIASGPAIGSSEPPADATPQAWPPPSRVRRERPPRLVVDHVAYRYPSGQLALDDVSLEVGQGELVALVGHNGSGKTTLAKHLIGALAPTRGAVTFDGASIGSLRPELLACRVGYVFQDPDHQLFAATVWDEVAFGPRNVGCSDAEVETRVREALAAVDLADATDDPFLLDKGERQRLAVASVLSLRPDVLVLDEPTTGLDDAEQRRMCALLRSLHAAGQTICIITHTPWVIAEHAERVVMLRRGRLAYDGSVRGFFADPALVAAASFEAPEVTRLGWALGCVPLGVDELLGWMPGAG